VEQLLKFAKRLEGMDESLSNSPALRQAIRELSRYREQGDDRWQALADKASGFQVPEWARLDQKLGLELERLVPENGFSLPHFINVPRPPQVNWPTPHISSGSVPSWSVPHFAPPATGGEFWGGLLTVGVLVTLGLLAWRLSAWHREHAANGVKASRRLGGWPVDPARVRTREELVRAFEYLSLLRLGFAARNWNHLEIATRLGSQAPPASPQPDAATPPSADPRHAAEELAALYEQARYAPPSDAIADAALAAARRDLCYLAGVHAV
jgi:hypothetical protein